MPPATAPLVSIFRREIGICGPSRARIPRYRVLGIVGHLNLTLTPDPRPEAGLYYRSDHFSFARVGIPAFSVDGGDELVGKPEGEGAKLFKEFNDKRYHQPSDEYNDDWDFAGMEQFSQFGLLIGIDVANQGALPTWRAGDEFLPARQSSGVK